MYVNLQCVRVCVCVGEMYVLCLFVHNSSPSSSSSPSSLPYADAEVLPGRPLQTTRATQSAKLQIWPAYEYENECEYEYLAGYAGVCVCEEEGMRVLA